MKQRWVECMSRRKTLKNKHREGKGNLLSRSNIKLTTSGILFVIWKKIFLYFHQKTENKYAYLLKYLPPLAWLVSPNIYRQLSRANSAENIFHCSSKDVISIPLPAGPLLIYWNNLSSEWQLAVRGLLVMEMITKLHWQK